MDDGEPFEQTDLDPYIRTLREYVRAAVDDDELYEVMSAAVVANREARDHHDRQLLRIQDQINRRAAVYGEAWEQVMRQALELERP